MGNFRNKLMKFMSGRYGFDDLGKFLILLYLIIWILTSILDIFVNGAPIIILSAISLAIMLYAFFRMFSRSIYKRRNENEAFKKIKVSFSSFIRLQKNKYRDRRTHVYGKCPDCKAVLRLKKIKGKHRAACPRCGKSFDIFV